MRFTKRIWVRTASFIVLLAFTAFFFVPIVWLLLAPTKTDHQLLVDNPFAIGSFHNLATAWRLMFGFENHTLLSWLENSAIYSFGGVALAIVCAIPAGYGLALTEFIGRKTLLGITLVVMIMPSAALVLPLFLEINAVHLVGSPFSVILPFSFFPFGVYLCYIFYASTIPKDLLAAARVDGCSEWDVFRRIALPLRAPGRRARRLLRLCRRLDQLLSSLRDALQQLVLPTHGRVAGPAGSHAGVQPRDRQFCDTPPGAGHRDHRDYRPGACRLPLRPTLTGVRPARRGHEGVSHPSCLRVMIAGSRSLCAGDDHCDRCALDLWACAEGLSRRFDVPGSRPGLCRHRRCRSDSGDPHIRLNSELACRWIWDKCQPVGGRPRDLEDLAVLQFLWIAEVGVPPSSEHA